MMLRFGAFITESSGHLSDGLATWALMLDPLTSACCTPSQIEQMTADLFAAEAEFLPDYR